ncbi:uncharacterized protein BT62DRAFT_1003275 [Guyanagaster necrorhizus]|uniref:Uncharacterized protein n=1 Tax=Guyanagaster necrorhizus TaxID=856835 RepID=A0A9P7VX66_9AGAR|nr:uncharacterized protein BT62DRAFT_1003275 [Guyanagaster necrorhizus MCA 3950]KAG7448562.1 hypothetical protein BT62DRAFT_1003275 [Guyanagaster necrorhizus MCA 3950]
MQTKSSLNRVTPTSIGCHPSNEARSTKPTERVRHKVRSRTDITQAFLPIQTESMTSYAESDHPAPGKRGVWMPSPCSSKNPSTDVNHPLIGPQQAASRVDFGGRLQHPRGEILTLDGKMSLETHRHMERQAERAPCNMASPSTLAIPTSIDIYTCWAFAVEDYHMHVPSSITPRNNKRQRHELDFFQELLVHNCRRSATKAEMREEIDEPPVGFGILISANTPYGHSFRRWNDTVYVERDVSRADSQWNAAQHCPVSATAFKHGSPHPHIFRYRGARVDVCRNPARTQLERRYAQTLPARK